MKRSPLSLALCAAAATFAGAALLPSVTRAATLAAVPTEQKGAVQALEQAINPEQAIHQRIELYGALRLSVDYSDSDVSSSEVDAYSSSSLPLTDGGVSVSSNTSMIGFRGMVPINERYQGLWQYEQQINVDTSDSGDVWATRDSFLGVGGPFGSLLIGRVNTPFKNMSVAYLGYFNVVNADSHAIFGASSDGNIGTRLDALGSNSITWKVHKGDVSFQAQYSAAQDNNSNVVDDNNQAAYSAWARWQPGPFDLDAAWVHYEKFHDIASLDAWRVSAKYQIGPVTLGALYENIDVDDPLLVRMDRPAYGAQVTYSIAPRWIAAAQWNHAEETDIGDDEADQYSATLYHPINQQLLINFTYTTTRNGDNASYKGVAYSHDDRVGTLPGRNPQSFSIGAQLKF